MRISHNIPGMNANRILDAGRTKQAKSTEKLSSGYKVNRAADDAAGLAISEKMRAQIRGLNQAGRNIRDGVSLINVADGALSEITNMLQRIRELAVQAASDVNETVIDRAAIQVEIDQLITEIDKTVMTAEFNSIKLFDSAMIGEIIYEKTKYVTITPKDPAYLQAGAPFDGPLRIVSGTQASQNFPASNTNLATLDGPPPTFPLEGIFVVQVQVPGQTMRAAVLDFSVKNADGNFTLADFRDFFETEFNDLIEDEELVVNITDSGQIEIRTTGFGGSQAYVNVGATSGTGVPSSTRLANSAIFGTKVSGPDDPRYHRAISDTTITPEQLTEINEGPGASELLWDLVPDSTTFTWQLQEWTYNPALGTPGSANSYNQTGVLHTVTMTKAQLVTASGATTFAAANAYLATQGDGVYFSSLTLGAPSVYVNREGTAYVNFNPNAGRIINDPALPHRYRVAVPSAELIYNNNASAASTSVMSSFPAIISDEIGLLTIDITNVPETATEETTISLTIDFSDPMWTASSTPQDLVDYINAELNAIEPYKPTPYHTNAGYDPSKPVAAASINSNGRLVITAAERSFGIDIKETLSDRPMYFSARSGVSGSSQTSELTISGYPGGKFTIEAGDYEDIDDFISRNAHSFHPDYTLSNNNGSLLITSTAKGENITINGISFTQGSTTGLAVFQKLGLQGLVKGTDYFDGVTYESYMQQLPKEIKWSQALPKTFWIQSGANQVDGVFLDLSRMDAHILGLRIKIPKEAFGKGLGFTHITSETKDIDRELSVMSHVTASAAISRADTAINIVSLERARLGAISNRLEHKLSNVEISSENLTASESRIRDADVAKEMAALIGENIVTQSATAMLAQANALPQSVLQVLQ